tara:strand:- start:1898 stop:2287 length:390 start_codon:yes stop_codon:yes gene_type:complete
MVTMEECSAYASKIKATDYWKQHKGWLRVNLHHGAGHRSAKYYRAWSGRQRCVVLPKWARSEIVMIHEFAHCLTDRTTGGDYSGHGTHFCGHYLNLVGELLGEDYKNRLMEQFDEDGVRYHFQKSKNKG